MTLKWMVDVVFFVQPGGSYVAGGEGVEDKTFWLMVDFMEYLVAFQRA